MSQAMLEQRTYGQGNDFWRDANTFLLGAFVSLLILVPWGYQAVPLVALALAFAGVVLHRGLASFQMGILDREDRLCLLSWVLFSALWCWDLARSDMLTAPVPGGWLMPLWPLLAALLLMWWRVYSPLRLGWWLGLIIGGAGAGCIAVYERFVLGAYRADNAMNAIPFGNLSLLIGILALVAMLGRLPRPLAALSWLIPLLGLAAVAGLAASLLSGTRGGWVAVPLLAWVSYRAFRSVFSRRQRLLIAGSFWLLIAGLTAMTAITDYGVQQRAERAINDIRVYLVEGDGGSSVGLRLEMWRAGGQMLLQKPLLGWGESGLVQARDEMVADGTLHPAALHHDQLHSDLVDTAARRGLAGVVTLLGLYGVPAWLFIRHLSRACDARTRTLALSGLLVVIAFVGFGLTQSMLRDVRGLSGYLGLVLACWVLLKAHLSGPELPLKEQRTKESATGP